MTQSPVHQVKEVSCKTVIMFFEMTIVFRIGGFKDTSPVGSWPMEIHYISVDNMYVDRIVCFARID